MKAIIATGRGLKPCLSLADVHEPGRPGPDDVLVKVHASSVNPKDWKLNYPLASATRPVPVMRPQAMFGDDLAGVVLAVGRRVTDFGPGDAIFGMDMRLRTAALAEKALIDHTCIALMPSCLSFIEAAAIPLAGQTALQGLRKGKVKAGSRVLIIGSSGGVGTFAVQIAKALGCHVTAVCSTAKIDLMRELGADEAVDYTAGDFRDGIGNFDLVFDVASRESPRSCSKLIADGGWFISTGGTARSMLGTPLFRLLGKKADSMLVQPRRADLETLADMVEKGQLKPVIDSEFALADAHEAYRRSRSGRCRGKVVIRIV